MEVQMCFTLTACSWSERGCRVRRQHRLSPHRTGSVWRRQQAGPLLKLPGLQLGGSWGKRSRWRRWSWLQLRCDQEGGTGRAGLFKRILVRSTGQRSFQQTFLLLWGGMKNLFLPPPGFSAVVGKKHQVQTGGSHQLIPPTSHLRLVAWSAPLEHLGCVSSQDPHPSKCAF